MVKTWNAERLGKNQEGQICYEVCCRKSEEPALRKILEVFFNLNGE